MALPKRKYAKARQGKRRSHLKLTVPSLVPCTQCHNIKPAHQACPFCGTYRGREIIKASKPKSK
ncbi:MAG: 50S ribosomal protein L32 [Dehalococcoidia bacterium]|jgi:large subunit ribosomal protein L32|nr:50S ribosomal protein L32 [Dehalococcoidia bacterium]